MTSCPWARAGLAVPAICLAALVAVGASASASEPSAGLSALSKIVIDQVEVEGIKALSPEAVEASVEIGTGELLDQSKVIRTVQNLREQYRLMGYERTSISTRLTRRSRAEGKKGESILEIKVEEGAPTRLVGINFVLSGSVQEGDTGASELGDSAWLKLQHELISKVSVKTGEILTQDRMAAIRRLIQEVFVSDQYIGARVEDFKSTEVAAPQGNPSAAEASEGRWVSLQAWVRPGERVSFGFRGNQVLGQARLGAIVDEQRSLGLGREYLSAIQARIEDEYRSLGYAKVKVRAYTFELTQAQGPNESNQGHSRHVTFQISEGPRVQIESVDFDGNSYFTNSELRSRFNLLAPAIVQRGYYVEKEIEHGAGLLIEWMKSQGFLSAKLTTISTTYPLKPLPQDKDRTVKLVVYLYEGDQTIVQSIATAGNTVFDQGEIAKFLGLKEGAPLNLFALSEGLQALKAAYRAKGFLSVAVTNESSDRLVKYSDENRMADVAINLSEGPRYKVSRIDIEGRSQTQETVILRECPLRPGDILEEPKLSETEANLRRLGIFSSVKVRSVQDPDHPEGQVIKISVDEAPPGVVAGGPGFRNDLGIRGFAELGYTNLWGDNHSVFLDLAANRRIDSTFRFGEYQTQLAYNWPWFAGTDITFRPTVNLSGTEYTNFDAVTAELALNWEKKILRSPNLIGVFTYSLERVVQFNAIDAEDNGSFRIGSFTPSLRLDMRDNPLSPTRGLYAQTSFEWADPAFLSQIAESPIGYTRFQFRSDYIVPLSGGVSWLFSFRTGLERSTVSKSDSSTAEVGYGSIPLIKRFALGGIASLRGYQEQELNINNIIYLTGSASYVNYRTQVDLPITGNLRIGPFLDAANLQVDTYSFGNLLYGAGFGIRYMTPVGPVSFDYGWKLNAPSPSVDSNTATSNFYFSVGAI